MTSTNQCPIDPIKRLDRDVRPAAGAKMHKRGSSYAGFFRNIGKLATDFLRFFEPGDERRGKL